VLRKSMARDARDRFDTAGEFGEAFQQSADQRPTVTLHASEIRRAATPTLKLPAWVRTLKRHEVRLGLAGGVLLAMLGTMYALWPSAPSPPANAAPIVGPPRPAPPLEHSNPESTEPPPVASSSPTETAERVDTNPSVLLGSLQIESNTSANVLLDGQPIGTAPGLFQSVEPGERRIILDAGQGRVHEKTVVVTAGSTHHLRFDFEATPVDVTGAMVRPHQSSGSVSSASGATPRRFDRRPAIRTWTGWLTDADCGSTGGKQGALHLRCAERCIRAGQQPMLYSRGKLYRIDGFEHVNIVRGEPLEIRGWLEVDTIHVIDPQS
jgi:hypothetical protein